MKQFEISSLIIKDLTIFKNVSRIIREQNKIPEMFSLKRFTVSRRGTNCTRFFMDFIVGC